MKMKAYMWMREVVLHEMDLHRKRVLDFSDVKARHPDPRQVEASVRQRVGEDDEHRERRREGQDLEVRHQHHRHVGHLTEDPETIGVSVLHGERAFEKSDSGEQRLPEHCDRY